MLVALWMVCLAEGWAAAPILSAPASQIAPDAAPSDNPKGEASTAGIPVILDGETLFHIYTYVGPYSPEERAKAASSRILRLAQDPLFHEGLFTIETRDDEVLVYYQGELMSVVTAEEATAEGTTPENLTELRIETVEKAIERYRSRRLPKSMLLGVVQLTISTVILIALLIAVKRLYRFLVIRVRGRLLASAAGRADKRRAPLVERTLGFQLKVLKLIRAVVVVFLIALYLQTAFLFIPITRNFAWGVLHYFLNPLGVLGYSILANVGNFFFIMVVLALATGLLRVLRWLAHEAAQGTITVPGVSPDWVKPMHRLVRLLVFGVVAVVIYPYIPGSSSAAFKGISIFAGALFTLGASSTAGNFIGGVALMFSGTLRMGDRVMIGEVTGDVMETGVLITRIRTPKNEKVSIPNGLVLSGRVVNYSALANEGRLILHSTVSIGYDTPWRIVHELLLRAAVRTSGIEPEPAPFVLQKQLNDFFVTYEINAHTRNANAMALIYGELHQNIQDTFNAAGVEIMSPHYASLRDGNATTIPESCRSGDGEAKSRSSPGETRGDGA